MEVITDRSVQGTTTPREPLYDFPSLSQVYNGKEAEMQLLQLVNTAKTQTTTLVKDYLSFQGPPFSGNGAVLPQAKLEGIPILDQNQLSPGLKDRMAQSLKAFVSLSDWLASVRLWQKDLNPKAHDLLLLLESAQSYSKAISSNLTTYLRVNVSPPHLTMPSTTTQKKVAGYTVCQSFYDWLCLTERDLLILVVESSV